MLWSSVRAAAAIVLISDPEGDIRARADELRERFGLTPAEATLALEIAKGGGRKATAERLGITGPERCGAICPISSTRPASGTRRNWSGCCCRGEP